MSANGAVALRREQAGAQVRSQWKQEPHLPSSAASPLSPGQQLAHDLQHVARRSLDAVGWMQTRQLARRPVVAQVKQQQAQVCVVPV